MLDIGSESKGLWKAHEVSPGTGPAAPIVDADPKRDACKPIGKDPDIRLRVAGALVRLTFPREGRSAVLVEFGRLPAPLLARIVQLALAAGLAAVLLGGSPPSAAAGEPASAVAAPSLDELPSAADAPGTAPVPRTAALPSSVVVRTSALDPRALSPVDFADWDWEQQR